MGPALSTLNGNFVAVHIFRINHFPKKRKRDEEEEGYSCAAQWKVWESESEEVSEEEKNFFRLPNQSFRNLGSPDDRQ